VAEIQALFSVTRGTVVQHLGRCVWSGQRFAPERIRELSALNQDVQTRVLAEFATHGTERLRPVFEALEEVIPYDELHIMRMLALCLGNVTSTAQSRGQ
jgi:ATP-dependent DNA helicase RecQ